MYHTLTFSFYTVKYNIVFCLHILLLGVLYELVLNVIRVQLTLDQQDVQYRLKTLQWMV